MSLNCAELKNLFMEKPKRDIANNHIENYDYCRLLYENAKRRKSLERRNSNIDKEERKFNDVYTFLRELEVEGAFADDESDTDYYSDVYWTGRKSSGLGFGELIRARRQHRVHSSDNSDYSFWSLDGSVTSGYGSGSGYNNSMSDPLMSNYSDLLRIQSKYFYFY